MQIRSVMLCLHCVHSFGRGLLQLSDGSKPVLNRCSRGLVGKGVHVLRTPMRSFKEREKGRRKVKDLATAVGPLKDWVLLYAARKRATRLCLAADGPGPSLRCRARKRLLSQRKSVLALRESAHCAWSTSRHSRL